MLTAERIGDYAELGYTVKELTKSRRNKAKNWQVKVAMSEIDPRDFKGREVQLPMAVWQRAKKIYDAEQTERYINQAKATVKAIKYKQKSEDYQMAFIIAVAVWFYTTFFAIVAYFTRI